MTGKNTPFIKKRKRHTKKPSRPRPGEGGRYFATRTLETWWYDYTKSGFTGITSKAKRYDAGTSLALDKEMRLSMIHKCWPNHYFNELGLFCADCAKNCGLRILQSAPIKIAFGYHSPVACSVFRSSRGANPVRFLTQRERWKALEKPHCSATSAKVSPVARIN